MKNSIGIEPAAGFKVSATIYRTLGKFLRPLATINLPKSPTFLGNVCKGVKHYPFSNEIIFWQLL